MAVDETTVKAEVIDQDRLIQDVFRKYKVSIAPDDPIFHYLFMHDVIFERSVAYLVKLIGKGRYQQLEEAKKVSEQLAARTVNALALTGNKHEERLLALFDQQFDRFEQQHCQHMKHLKQAQWSALFVGALGGGVVGLVFVLSGLMAGF